MTKCRMMVTLFRRQALEAGDGGGIYVTPFMCGDVTKWSKSLSQIRDGGEAFSGCAPLLPLLLPLHPQRKTSVVMGDHFWTGVVWKQPVPSCILLRGQICDSLLVMKRFHVHVKGLKKDVHPVGCLSGSTSPLAVASSCHLRVVKKPERVQRESICFSARFEWLAETLCLLATMTET